MGSLVAGWMACRSRLSVTRGALCDSREARLATAPIGLPYMHVQSCTIGCPEAVLADACRLDV